MKSESLLFFRMVSSFLTSYLPRQKGASPHTIRAYKVSLNKFLDYACTELGIKLQDFHFGLIKRDIIEKYLEHLETDDGYSVKSRNLRLAAIKSFCKFSAYRDVTFMSCYQEVSLVPLKKEADHVIDIFSENALKAILDAPDISRKNGLRDRMFMALMYDTAARLQEILNLHLDDVHLDRTNSSGKSFITVTGKGQKRRLIPLMTKTVEHLEGYINCFHAGGNNDYLFYVCHKGKREPLSQDAVEKFIRKYGIKARQSCEEVPEKLYPHMFRHSRATHLYRGGMQLPLVSEWPGHSQMKTTSKFYASANTEMKKEAIEKATSKLNPILTSCIDFDIEYDDDTIRRLYGLA